VVLELPARGTEGVAHGDAHVVVRAGLAGLVTDRDLLSR